MLFIRLKSMQTPPLVAVMAPEKLVPPEHPTVGILHLEHISIIALISDVSIGSSTKLGDCEGGAGDHGVEEWALSV